jgi:acetyl esterase/lipase
MDYLDNPGRRSATQPSDNTSANGYGFAVAPTRSVDGWPDPRLSRLSDTVRVHRKLRQAGIEAQLQVFEGQSHVAYLLGPSPEGREVFDEVAAFFDTHLGK